MQVLLDCLKDHDGNKKPVVQFVDDYAHFNFGRRTMEGTQGFRGELDTRKKERNQSSRVCTE